MRELAQFEINAVSAAAGSAGAPLASGAEIIGGGRIIGEFAAGFLRGFYDAF